MELDGQVVAVLLDLPDGSLVSDGKLEVLLGDRVPVLVDHHHAEEHAERKEEEPVDVVLDRVADRDRERKQDNAADSEEPDSEQDVSDDLTIESEDEKVSSAGRE